MISMTEPPINLDVIKAASGDLDAYQKGKQDTDGGYLKAVMKAAIWLPTAYKELVAARERVAELEAEYITLEEIHEDELYMIKEEVEDKLAKAIIPQADDTEYLRLAIGHAEYCRSITAELFSLDKIDPEIAMLKRYLAAIEGVRP
jgi:hypothetical protein